MKIGAIFIIVLSNTALEKSHRQQREKIPPVKNGAFIRERLGDLTTID